MSEAHKMKISESMIRSRAHHANRGLYHGGPIAFGMELETDDSTGAVYVVPSRGRDGNLVRAVELFHERGDSIRGIVERSTRWPVALSRKQVTNILKRSKN